MIDDELVFFPCLRDAGIPMPETEFKFHPSRKWKFDYAWPDKMLALEKEGGIFGKGKPCPVCKQKRVGGHSSVAGILRDIEKYNAATVLGWRIIRAVPTEMCRDATLDMVKALLERL